MNKKTIGYLFLAFLSIVVIPALSYMLIFRKSSSNNAKQDCEYTWSEYTDCGSDCKKSRTINITTQPSGGGKQCPSSPETISCTGGNCTNNAKQDCEYTWSEYTDCGSDCKKSRTINITKQPSGGGKQCPSSPDIISCTGGNCTNPNPTPNPPDPGNCPNGNSSPPAAGHGGKWESAYFLSSGTKGPYTSSDLKKNTTSKDLDGGSPNGADPSCGSRDTDTWNKCFNGSEKDKYQHILAYQTMMGTDDNNLCRNCDGTDGDCNGHIILQDSNNGGKVAVLAHGPFGDLPTISYDDDNNPIAICTTSHLGCGYDPISYGSLVSKFKYIVNNGPTNLSLKEYVSKYEPTSSVLITKKAFVDAGLQNVWNDLGAVANGGVALSWGHGYYGNGCGDMVFVKQGNISPTINPTYTNNVSLNLQIGTRAWSGEMTDTTNSTQEYIVQGLDDAADSASCLQPLTIPFSASDVNKLFTFLCSKTSNKCITDPSTLPCQYVNTSIAKGGDCTAILNKDNCEAAAGWGCGWVGN